MLIPYRQCLASSILVGACYQKSARLLQWVLFFDLQAVQYVQKFCEQSSNLTDNINL